MCDRGGPSRNRYPGRQGRAVDLGGGHNADPQRGHKRRGHHRAGDAFNGGLAWALAGGRPWPMPSARRASLAPCRPRASAPAVAAHKRGVSAVRQGSFSNVGWDEVRVPPLFSQPIETPSRRSRPS